MLFPYFLPCIWELADFHGKIQNSHICNLFYEGHFEVTCFMPVFTNQTEK